jgi:hypothetical protein
MLEFVVDSVHRNREGSAGEALKRMTFTVLNSPVVP